MTKADTDTLLEFYDEGRQDGGSFDNGIQFALERMLVDPDFLLRVIRDPAPAKAGVYRLSDLELASRLSFFLWSSIPDDHLLTLAEHKELSNPQTLEKEVRRMLADPRATDALVNDFAAQWLDLRQVEDVVVDPDQVSQLRLEPAAGVRERNRDVRGQHAARGSPRVGSAGRELHLCQRAGRPALWDSGKSTAAASGA